VFIKGLNINRLLGSKTNKIIFVMAIASLLIIGAAAFSPFDQIRVSAQQQENHNSNTPKLSLSTVSTAVGTGAAATGAIVTVPGLLRTRNQSKCLSIYLLKIHGKYDELCRKTKPVNTKEYLDFLDTLRSDIIYLLQRRHKRKSI
jgi:hypothetical protein